MLYFNPPMGGCKVYFWLRCSEIRMGSFRKLRLDFISRTLAIVVSFVHELACMTLEGQVTQGISNRFD